MAVSRDPLVGGLFLSTGITLGASGFILLFAAVGELLIELSTGNPLAANGIAIGVLGCLLIALGVRLGLDDQLAS